MNSEGASVNPSGESGELLSQERRAVLTELSDQCRDFRSRRLKLPEIHHACYYVIDVNASVLRYNGNPELSFWCFLLHFIGIISFPGKMFDLSGAKFLPKFHSHKKLPF